MNKTVKVAVVQPVKEGLQSLSVDEQKQLAEFESKIENGQRSFIAVGEALTRINETQLYKGTHSSFDKYCEERWDFSGSQGWRLIQAFKVVTTLRSAKVAEHELPANESQARLLAEQHENHWFSRWKKVLKAAKAKEKRVTTTLIQEVFGLTDGESAVPKTKANRIKVAATAVEEVGLVEDAVGENSAKSVVLKPEATEIKVIPTPSRITKALEKIQIAKELLKIFGYEIDWVEWLNELTIVLTTEQ